ncbi:hypothetical protein FACS189454_03220 [Planctomycetales bacterium]|nr:hypothetical protein FACS189454_03220 [Planctomycetales bacterium]
MDFYYYDTTGRKGPFNRTQLQIQVNNRKVIKDTPVETDEGQRGLAGQLNWLVFPPPKRPWWRVFDALFSGFGRLVSWILNTILLLLVVTVLASAIGTAVCVLAYQDAPWVVMGWVPPKIQCSSGNAYRESVRRTKDWWYSKQDKDNREEHKKTMDELNRLSTALKDETIDFAKVQDSMIDELGKRTIKDIDAGDLSKSIDKWIEEEERKKQEEIKKAEEDAWRKRLAEIQAAKEAEYRRLKEEFDTSRVNSDTIEKMKKSEFGKEFSEDCDFLSRSLSWSQQDLLTALNGKTAKEVNAYRSEKEAFLILTVSRENVDKMLTDDQFRKDWDYLSGNGQENEELKNECEKLKDTAKKSEFLKKLELLSKGKSKDELLSELNGNNFAEVHRYSEKFASDLAGKYADVGGEINEAYKAQLDKDELERLEKEWQKKLAELIAKAAQAKRKAVWLRDELREKGFANHQTGDYIRYGTGELCDAYYRGDPIERRKLEPKLKFPPIDAAKKIFKNTLDLSIGEPRKDGNGWSANIGYSSYPFGSFRDYHFTYWTSFGVHTAGSAWRDIRTTLKCSETEMASFTRNKGNYDVVVVFNNLRIESGNYCANLISADIVDKVTGKPVVYLYPETKLAKQSVPSPKPVSPTPPPDPVDEAQQIKNIVDGFLAMKPNEYVREPLTSFKNVIIPQLSSDIALGKTAITFRNKGFIRGGNEEKIKVDMFLKSSKAQQFDTIWKTACGRNAVSKSYYDNLTSREKEIVGACQAFREQIAKEEKMPAADDAEESPEQ